MTLSYLAAAALIVAGFFTAIISALTGMAGGITLLSIMTFFIGWQALIPLHGIVQLVSNSYRSYLLRANIRWQLAAPFFLGAPLGMLVTTVFIFKNFPKDAALVSIACLILYSVFRPKKLPHVNIPDWGFFFVGFLVGLLGPIVGATGPFLAVFFLRPDLSKNQVIATKGAVQFFGHLIKIPAFLYLGFDYLPWLPFIILISLSTLLGTRYGIYLLQKVPERIFFLLFKGLLTFAALRILYKVFL